MKLRCSTCKNWVERDDALRFGVQSFCDDKCAGKYQRKANKKKPKKNPMSHDLRIVVMNRDLQRCCYCGTRHGLEVHHVTYLSEGGKHESTNLVTLCGDHHRLVHSDKHVYQPLLFALIERRSSGDSHVLVPGL